MPHHFTEERLRELSAGYDLDGGGYGFEVWDEVPGLRGVVWDDPDPDYVPWIYGSHTTAAASGFYGLENPLYIFVPSDTGTAEFPDTFTCPASREEGHYRLVRHGWLTETDRECWCRDPEGNGNPDCHRCGGEGSVVSEGGCWALYAWQERVTHTFELCLETTTTGERPEKEAVRSVLEHSTAAEAIALGLDLEDAEVRLVLANED